MLKKQVLKVVGETAMRIDPKLSRQEKFEVFCRVVDNLAADGRPNDKITFSSSYYCWNFLPKQIIMEKLAVPPRKVVRTHLQSDGLEVIL